MQPGEFICVNNTKHQNIQIFDTSDQMRVHWHSCHGIDQGEILLPFVMPSLNMGPAPALGQRAALGIDANANLTGAAGPSDSDPKGTAGTVSESGKGPKKTTGVGIGQLLLLLGDAGILSLREVLRG